LDVLTDKRRTFDARLRIDDRPLPYPHAVGDLEPGHLDVDEAIERILLCLAVRVDVPNVGPVALGDVPEDRRAFRQQGGEDVFREVVLLAFGDVVEDLRLEDVDAGVNGVGENLAPARL